MKEERIEQLSHDIHSLTKEFRDYGIRQFKDTDLNPYQARLLGIVEKYKDLNQAQLARKLEITPATLSVRIKKLEEAGFLKRVEDDNDKRNYRLELTETGKANLLGIRDIFKNSSKQLFQGLSDQELETLIEIVAKCRNNIKEAD